MGRPPGDAGTRAATKGGATKTGRPGGRGGGFDFMSRLTDDQRKKLDAKVAELRAKNASPQEIFKATGDMLKSWGIEVPDMSRAGGNRRWGGGEFSKLTDEQRRQFFAKMGELRQQNASPEKVRAEAEKMLKGFGLDPSKIQWPTGRGARGAPGGAQPGGPAPQGKAGGPTKF
ncbi:MAG: hypothetical protein HPY69_15390 [Armatimonadetes bacterium]|nr:hypothetical protein [Armatimonadota bacterium]